MYYVCSISKQTSCLQFSYFQLSIQVQRPTTVTGTKYNLCCLAVRNKLQNSFITSRTWNLLEQETNSCPEDPCKLQLRRSHHPEIPLNCQLRDIRVSSQRLQ
jgi:hypothetical protein